MRRPRGRNIWLELLDQKYGPVREADVYPSACAASTCPLCREDGEPIPRVREEREPPIPALPAAAREPDLGDGPAADNGSVRRGTDW